MLTSKLLRLPFASCKVFSCREEPVQALSTLHLPPTSMHMWKSKTMQATLLLFGEHAWASKPSLEQHRDLANLLPHRMCPNSNSSLSTFMITSIQHQPSCSVVSQTQHITQTKPWHWIFTITALTTLSSPVMLVLLPLSGQPHTAMISRVVLSLLPWRPTTIHSSEFNSIQKSQDLLLLTSTISWIIWLLDSYLMPRNAPTPSLMLQKNLPLLSLSITSWHSNHRRPLSSQLNEQWTGTIYFFTFSTLSA